MERLLLAFRVFWRILTVPEDARRVESALGPQVEGPDLRILAVLQRDGRLVDFLQEEIDGYTDGQIGAAVRDIHRGCRKALGEYLTLEPVLAKEEGERVEVGPDFDPAAIRLSGNVAGSPPFRGTLKHHGWRVKSASLPALPNTAASRDHSVLAPAEVEIG